MVRLALLVGTFGSFAILSAVGFDPLRTALLMNAGLIAATVFIT